MKTILAATAIALLALPALAQTTDNNTNQPGVPRANVKGTPSGYEIAGCAHYEQVGNRTRQVCNERAVTPALSGKATIFDRASPGPQDTQ